jgi:hypothetical protein
MKTLKEIIKILLLLSRVSRTTATTAQFFLSTAAESVAVSLLRQNPSPSADGLFSRHHGRNIIFTRQGPEK